MSKRSKKVRSELAPAERAARQERDVASPALASDVRIQRKGSMKKATWVSLGLFVASLLGLFLVAFLGGPALLARALGWSLLITPMLAIVAAAVGQMRLRAGRALSIRGSDVRIEHYNGRGERTIPVSALQAGWVSPAERLVYLESQSGDIVSATIGDEADGQAILEAAGLDASKRTMRLRLGPVDFLNAMAILVGPAIAFPIAQTIGSALLMGGSLPGPLGLALYFGQFYLIRQIFGPATLVIGADGVIVRQRFRTRFVSYEDLRSVSTADDNVTLHLTSGASVRARARHLDGAARSTIQARISAALAARGSLSAEAGALAALDRGSRTLADWRAAMSSLFDQNRGYRAASLNRDQVARVLSDPAASLARRVGAALALAASGDAEAPARIRVAAGACANPKAKLAFETIADGAASDRAIDEAIAEEEASEAAASPPAHMRPSSP